jgi:protein O-GlcNAc transferase
MDAPRFAGHNNLGNALRDRGQLDEAMAAYRRALELKPDYPEAQQSGRCTGRERQGRVDEAMAAYRRALELKPDYAEAHNNLGNALKERGQLDEAIAAYRRALELKPDYPEATTIWALRCSLSVSSTKPWPRIAARSN